MQSTIPVLAREFILFGYDHHDKRSLADQLFEYFSTENRQITQQDYQILEKYIEEYYQIS